MQKIIEKIKVESRAKKVLYFAILVIVVVVLIFLFKNKNNTNETITVKLGDFVNQVSVSGKVISSENVDLGFSQGGRISSIRAKVGNAVNQGTVIASIENGDLQANLAQREAGLLREQAKLKSLELGTRDEQIAVSESSVLSAKSALTEAEKSVLNTIEEAYTKSDDAVRNKADQFFKNPSTSNPQIIFTSTNSNDISEIEQTRASMEVALKGWNASLSKLNQDTLVGKIKQAENNLSKTRSFLDKISSVINNPNTIYNSVPIPALWKNDISSARASIDGATSILSSAISNYENAKTNLVVKENSLKLEKAGATAEDIQAQIAQVKGAEADVMSARATLNKTLIVAPFNGIITKMDAKVGEIASPNTSMITMMGVGTFQIESFIPEVNIAKVELGDNAKVTLDAYGDSVFFDAKVISIDPAETIKDGVSTYKTKLQFSNVDSRIKSGMTANVAIVIFNKSNVIVVPGGVVFDKTSSTNGGQTTGKFVQVKINEKIEDREVVTGEISSLGQFEIVKGLADGDQVILNPTIK
jgi:RND family efflux transporter MFP subunit